MHIRENNIWKLFKLNPTIIKNNQILNVVLLTLYLFFILASLIIQFDLMILLLPALCLSYVISINLVYYISIINFKFNTTNDKLKYRFFIFNFIILFLFHFIFNYIKGPVFGKTLFENDTYDSINLALNNNYTEYRGTMYTFLFCKIPLTIINNVNFIHIYYMIIRSFIISFIISKIACNNILIDSILLIYYIFMPLSIHSEMCLLKDTPCSLFIMTVIFLVYSSLYNKNNNRKIIDFAVGLFLALAYFMRANAIAFCVPFVFSLLYVYRKTINKFFRVLITFICALLLINFFIYNILHSAKFQDSTKFYETVGIPISVVLTVAKEKPELLNEDEKKLITNMELYFPDTIKHYNKYQGWESVKPYVTEKSLYGMSYADLFEYIVDLFKKDSKLVLNQLILSTSGLYAFRNLQVKRSNSFFAKIYYLLASMEVPFLFLMLIVVFLSRNPLINNANNNNLVLILPMIIFSFATMLVIASPAITRYFLPLQMSFPLYIYYNFKNINKES